MNQPRIAHVDDVDADLHQRVEQPVPTFAEQALELAVTEVQTPFRSCGS